MDTSETYIKMCEQAKKIQAIWHDPKLIGVHPADKGFGLHYEKGYEGSFYWDGVCVSCVDYEYETTYKRSHVWLPRQDQLQEMLGDFDMCKNHIYSAGYFDNEYSKYHGESSIDYWDKFTSMEQLWLAFVMKEKFGKIWSGSEWIQGESQ